MIIMTGDGVMRPDRKGFEGFDADDYAKARVMLGVIKRHAATLTPVQVEHLRWVALMGFHTTFYVELDRFKAENRAAKEQTEREAAL